MDLSSSPYLVFPDFNPVAFSLGPLVVRWYALAYLTGFILGWGLAVLLGPRAPVRYGRRMNADDFGDFLTWGVLGVVLGGRLGYVLFYNLGHYLANPADILAMWHGGMSFHGGLLGMVVAAILFTRRRGIDTLAFGDILATVTTIGLGLGRLANFINGELVGRPVEHPETVPWAMVFPKIDLLPRHPSQLYEAGMEGLLLLLILLALTAIPRVRRHPGLRLGLFLCFYACFRALAEHFRTPDAQLGFIFGNADDGFTGGITMGQILCLPMFLIGAALSVYAARQPLAPDAAPVAVVSGD